MNGWWKKSQLDMGSNRRHRQLGNHLLFLSSYWWIIILHIFKHAFSPKLYQNNTILSLLVIYLIYRFIGSKWEEMEQKQENSEQSELRKKKVTHCDRITWRFLEVLCSILHIKLKIIERAFQRRIICIIWISNEGDTPFWKSVRAKWQGSAAVLQHTEFAEMPRNRCDVATNP